MFSMHCISSRHHRCPWSTSASCEGLFSIPGSSVAASRTGVMWAWWWLAKLLLLVVEASIVRLLSVE